MAEDVREMKEAPASEARALARRVFPVPGGPNRRTPLTGWEREGVFGSIFYNSRSGV